MVMTGAPRTIPVVETPSEPAHLEQMKCSRCGNGLALVHLTVGSVVQMRCHHSIKRPDGTRGTCGWVNRAWPSR